MIIDEGCRCFVHYRDCSDDQTANEARNGKIFDLTNALTTRTDGETEVNGMEPSVFTDSRGNLLTARTWGKLTDEEKKNGSGMLLGAIYEL